MLTVSNQHVTTEKSLTIHVTNNSTSTIEFGEPFNIYKLENGSWAPFPGPRIWILPLYIVPPGGHFSQVVNITGAISGRYRATKWIRVNGTGKSMSADFIVQRPSINPGGGPEYGYALEPVSLSSEGRFIELYNHGGLAVTLPSEFHVYHKEGGRWVEVDGNPGSDPSATVAPGAVYREHLNVRVPTDSLRYMRWVYVEGYNKPVLFFFEFD